MTFSVYKNYHQVWYPVGVKKKKPHPGDKIFCFKEDITGCGILWGVWYLTVYFIRNHTPVITCSVYKKLSPGVISCGGCGISCNPDDKVQLAGATKGVRQATGCDSTSAHPQDGVGGVVMRV